MDALTVGHNDNRLLAALPRDTFELVRRNLRQISSAQGRAIYEPGQQMDEIYFPQSGMISLLVVVRNGAAIETATVGREGAVGLHSAFGKRFSFTRATTQIAGNFSVIRATAFAQLAQDHQSVRDMIARYTEVLWAEAQQIAACNTIHDVPARLCRWLLQSADRIGSDHLPLTQEVIAEMLGVRRTTVTLFAQSLQRKDVIKYMRGHITILDRDHLQRCACECYGIMQQQKLPPKIGVHF